jgi:ABC-type glycerol-3-phosphate transport system substrate-binding protein
MKHKDIVLLILALMVLVFILVRMNKTAAADISVTAAPVLVFIHSWEGRDEILNNLKDKFELQYPEIEVQLVYKPYDEMSKALFGNSDDVTETAVIEGDVIAVDPLWISDLVKAGKIELEKFTVLSFFYPFYYNTEILKKAGFSGPPKTRTEFLTQARAIMNLKTGEYPIAFALEDGSISPYRDLYSWIWAADIAFSSPQNVGTRSPGTFLPAELTSIRQALDFFVTLHNENLLLPGSFLLDENEKREAFLNGRTAFMIGSAEDMELLRAGLGDALDYTAIPVPDNYSGRPLFGLGGWDLAIKRNSALKQEAMQFISFLLEHSPVLAHGWAIPENYNPVIPSDAFYAKAQELYISGNLVQDFANLAPRDQEGNLRPLVSVEDLDTVFREELMKLFEGETSSADAVQAISGAIK